MKTTQISKQSLPIRVIEFNKGEEFDNYEFDSIQKSHDSCSLARWVLKSLLFIFLKCCSIFLTAGLLVNSFFVMLFTWFYLGMFYWLDFKELDIFQVIASFMAILIGILLILAIGVGSIWAFTTFGIPWLTKFFTGKSQPLKETKLMKGTSELYSSFKDKFCSKIEFED